MVEDRSPVRLVDASSHACMGAAADSLHAVSARSMSRGDVGRESAPLSADTWPAAAPGGCRDGEDDTLTALGSLLLSAVNLAMCSRLVDGELRDGRHIGSGRS